MLGRAASFEGQSTATAHPFLSGNYAPQQQEEVLTPCTVTHGQVPLELAGSQYVRNGGNASDAFDEDRDAHWFDADGMLSGVFFKRGSDGLSIVPHFVNRFILTDIHLTTSPQAQRAILPSIATLINPAISLFSLTLNIMRALVLVFATWLPFLWTGPLYAWSYTGGKVKRISVANTSIWWHDRKALAACESGPPIQIRLPELDTGNWWIGQEVDPQASSRTWAQGPGLLKHFREYTTAHPKVDPVSGELMLYHMCFVAPFLRVSVIPSRDHPTVLEAEASGKRQQPALLGVTVPGISQPKLMHDFACTRTRTIILDLPLSLDPRNLLKGRPVMHYDAKKVGRLGIFPRWSPDQVQWLDTREAFCVYHTANAWDSVDPVPSLTAGEQPPAINLLTCRLNSATLAYVAGNVPPPPHVLPATQQLEKCQLYYWRIKGGPHVPARTVPSISVSAQRPELASSTEGSRPPSYHSGTSSPSMSEPSDLLCPLSPPPTYTDASEVDPLNSASLATTQSSPAMVTTTRANEAASIACEFPLSEIPFEFPTLNRERQMQAADYIYGTSTRASGFDSRLQKVGTGAAKIDCLVKMHVRALVSRGLAEWADTERGERLRKGGAAVDGRSVSEILHEQELRRSSGGIQEAEPDAIQIFAMPTGWYAQEATFVARANPRSEDDGFLLFYAFDELAGLDPSSGQCLADAKSELWVLDARDMHTVVCRIGLPQRVPYGLHGEWFDEAKIASQGLVPSLRDLEEHAKQLRRHATSVGKNDSRDGSRTDEKDRPFSRTEPQLRRRYRGPAGEVVSPLTPAGQDFPRAEGRLAKASWALRGVLEAWLK
ncbi:hypothetical protein V8E36_003371 [Tilletia maclaganii]